MNAPRASVERRTLGSSGRRVSILGLGCASYWAKKQFSERHALAVLSVALKAGINLLDTGASYAAGHAEMRLSRLLRQLDAVPEELLIGTKVGTVTDARGRLAKDFSSSAIVSQVDQSLKRLDLGRIGLLQLHGPEPDDLSDELLTTLDKLKTQGKVELLGVNGHDPVIRHCIGLKPFDVLMPFISVLKPSAIQWAEQAAASGQGVLAAGPLARMLFAPPLSRWILRPSGWWYLARALRYRSDSDWKKIRRLHSILQHPGWTPAQLAVAWVVKQPGISSAVFGTTQVAHVEQLVEAAARPLPQEVDEALNRFHTDFFEINAEGYAG